MSCHEPMSCEKRFIRSYRSRSYDFQGKAFFISRYLAGGEILLIFANELTP